MIVLGIDPGLSGGLAIVSTLEGGGTSLMAAIDVPTTGEGPKRRVDVGATLAFIRTHAPTRAVIERAQAMPDQGSSSGFNYGRAVGALEACALGMLLDLRIIESTAWKKAHGLIKRGKEDSRQRAIHLYPAGRHWIDRKMDHNRAEAILIAHYGLTL